MKPANDHVGLNGGRVAVILVNWNAWADVVRCLDSLLGQDYLEFDVYVVDNASSDQSLDQIEAWFAAPTTPAPQEIRDGVRYASATWHEKTQPKPIRLTESALSVQCKHGPSRIFLVASGGNLGFAGGNNVILKRMAGSGYRFAWLLNTDTVVDFAALSMLVRRALESDRPGITGSTLIYFDEPAIVQAQGGAYLDPTTMRTEHIGIGTSCDLIPETGADVEPKLAYVVGASMLVSMDFLEKIGPMEEDYFLYYEEHDWAMRALGQFKMGYAPASVVYHKVGASSAQVESAFSLRLLYRNKVRFLSRFFPGKLGLYRRQLIVELAKAVVRRQWQRLRVMLETLKDFESLANDAQKS